MRRTEEEVVDPKDSQLAVACTVLIPNVSTCQAQQVSLPDASHLQLDLFRLTVANKREQYRAGHSQL